VASKNSKPKKPSFTMLRRQFKALNWAHENVKKRLVEQIDQLAALNKALRDCLAFYDRVSGQASEASREGGWTAADIKRLEVIRKLVKP
jgi:hypothetical protein